MPELFPYQQEGKTLLAQRETALLADEPGLGKTAQAIAASDMIRAARILVLCPASARINWQREFIRFQEIKRKVKVIANGKNSLLPHGVNIISYDLASREALFNRLMAMEVDVLILDEAHYLKSRKARRTKAIFGNRCTRKGGLSEKAKHVYALTGTPAPNNPAELWPMMRALFPAAITVKERALDHWSFVRRFCRTKNNGFGIQILGGKNLPELRERLTPYLIRRKKLDVIKDLPPIRFESIVLEPGKLLKELKELEEGSEGEAIREVLQQANGDLSKVAIHVALLRRLTGLAKVQPVIDRLKDELEGGLEKIVLFAHHRDVIQGLFDGLSDYKPVSIHGAVPARKRQQAIDNFQNDPSVRIFIGQLSAAGTAITLTAASDALFVESSWVPADNAQAAMRVHRIGQHNPVLIRFATLAGSLDEQVTAAIRRKTTTLAELFG
ncbi:DEAD/DEAH box helicase [Magnetococcales bacterium HHB-1]